MANEKQQGSAQMSDKQLQQEMPREFGTELGRTLGGAAQAKSAPDTLAGAREMAENVGRAVTEQGEAVVEWIKARPVTSVAIGAAVAVLIGIVIGRNTRD
jgi:ElaB/YqjD/DUF883 family membrane-anchored ribosome-binding protein